MSPASTPIPEALQQFITRYVASVERVEILCIFAANPAKTYTVPEVQRIIQSSERSIADCLDNFRLNGLLAEQTGGSYRLVPKTNELAQLISDLATAYRERRVAVIEVIYGRRADAIQDFADAFKLRKDN